MSGERGFWIRPEGGWFVTENHISDIAADPSAFGLSGPSLPFVEARRSFHTLMSSALKNGFIRVRGSIRSADVVAELWRASPVTLGNLAEFMAFWNASAPSARVTIEETGAPGRPVYGPFTFSELGVAPDFANPAARAAGPWRSEGLSPALSPPSTRPTGPWSSVGARANPFIPSTDDASALFTLGLRVTSARLGPPRDIPMMEAVAVLMGIRRRQLGARAADAGATFRPVEGFWGDEPEPSVEIVIYPHPAEDAALFSGRMKDISQEFADRLLQEAVYLRVVWDGKTILSGQWRHE